MPSNLRRVCIFCGSSLGRRAEYRAAAVEVGRALARRGVTLVYGGGSVGLMGAAADAALAEGGQVIGVIPRALDTAEVGHRELTELHVVDSMHERKELMTRLSDGFITLPGGMGTLDELCECLTWAQLGIHHKPCGMLNTQGYFDRLIAFFDQQVGEGLLQPRHRALLIVADGVDDLLGRMREYESPIEQRWSSDVPPP